MQNTPTLRKVGLRVYIDGLGAKLYAEHSPDGLRIRLDSKGMWLMQRLDAMEKARRALRELNGGQEPSTMQDVLRLLEHQHQRAT